VSQLHDQGLAEEEVLVTDADGNTSQQATQISNLVQQGCHVIFVMQPPSVGLCQAYDQALQRGVLVVTMQTGNTCTSDIKVDFAEYHSGALTAKWLAEKIGG